MDMLDRPEFYFIFLTTLNLFNFLDRGIIPGATDEFISFIEEHIETDSPNFYIGILQSSFIIGFCLASPIFSTLTHHYGPFHLVAIGLSVWVVAVVLCGFSYYTDSYVVLLCGRILSGVGEASFQCCIPPWIALNAPSSSKSIWLSIFYTAMSVGLAMGYMYSSLIANSIGWQYSFFIEAIVIAPLLIFLYFTASKFPHVKPGVRHFEHYYESLAMDHEIVVPLRMDDNNATNDDENEATGLKESSFTRSLSATSNSGVSLVVSGLVEDLDVAPGDVEPPSLWEELKIIFNITVYVFICFGYAAQSATVIGLSTFGSSFLMGLGYFDSEVESSIIFGGLVSFAGIIGFPVGGALLDHLSTLNNPHKRKETDLSNSTFIMFLSSVVGVLLFSISTSFHNKTIFLFILFGGCLFLFICMAAINLGVILAVPPQNQSTGLAFSSIMLHVLGDVPSPIIVGLVKDMLAPGCTGDDDNVNTSEGCRNNGEGLRLTFLIVSLWLCWCVLFFGIAWGFALKGNYRSIGNYVDRKFKYSR